MSVLSETRGGVCRLTIDLPAGLHGEDFEAALAGSFEAALADPAARAIVLAGADRCFVAGPDADLVAREAAFGPAEAEAALRRRLALLGRVDASPKPVLVRIDGLASGLGLGLALAADVAVASEEAEFAAPETRAGLLPAALAPLLVRTVGPRQALRLVLTGERIRGAEARAIGLVHEVAPRVHLAQAADRALVGLIKGDPAALSAAKRLIAGLAAAPGAEALETAVRLGVVPATDWVA